MPLYLVATPIGNLQDISARALTTLKQVSLILCEDTRQTKKLLTHYGITTPVTAYHAHNEHAKTPQFVSKAKTKDLALVTDSGTPLISDPGYLLVKACRKENIPVIPIPGPNAAICALSASGFSAQQFFFYGFLPKKEQQKKKALEEVLSLKKTIIFYESPHRIQRTLALLTILAPARELCIARELTKHHESFAYGTAAELYQRAEQGEFKGELVLLCNQEEKHQQREHDLLHKNQTTSSNKQPRAKKDKR
ncbi:MAG: 16S rRNA (cytidine(1402)-2'-O)-methyltransferase [Candidatus Woesearchaeota archaeon]